MNPFLTNNKRFDPFFSPTVFTPTVFKNGKHVLFEGLSHADDTIQTRDEVRRRCPGFNLKSASDFMISVGLSHDVIALDTCVIGFLQKHLHYNIDSVRIQADRKYYFSLENELRKYCREQRVSLALLDRLIFNLSALSVVDFVISQPEFPKKSG